MSFCSVLRLVQPAPHIETLKDLNQVKEDYRYWRMRIFYSMYIGYLFYYFTRKSFTFITPFLSMDLGLTKANIGALASTLSIAYGISKFTSGILCDRSNPRYFMAAGLILTGICNILFGCFSNLYVLGLFWGLNGWFQGWGWPACTKQLTHWFSRSERGTWWSACTTSHTVGGFLIAYVAAFSAQYLGWRYAMFIPGIICIIVGIWLLERLRDVPQSLGLPTIEEFKNEGPVAQNEGRELLPVKQILFHYVLNNKFVWMLAISYFFVYVIRTAVNDWGTPYLTEVKGLSFTDSAICVSWFEIGGFFGILLAGFGSDYLFKGKRIPLTVLASLVLIFAVLGLWYLAPGQTIGASVLLAVIGFLAFTPQMLVGLAAAEFVPKNAASTSNGFAGFFGYVGAAVAGYPIGRLTDDYGWSMFIILLAVCSAITMLLLLPMWSSQKENLRSAMLSGNNNALISGT